MPNQPSPYQTQIIKLLEIYGHDYDVSDDSKTALPLPRDMPTDVAVLIKTLLSIYKITDIPVHSNGTFQTSLLRNAAGAAVPVVTVNLESDSSARFALGDIAVVFTGEDAGKQPGFVDKGQLVPEDASVTFRGQNSIATVEVSIYAENPVLATQMYMFIKTGMMAATDDFRKLGYTNPPLLVAGNQSAGIMEYNGSNRMIYYRSMVYVATYQDFIAGIDRLGSLIAVRGELDPAVDPDGDAQVQVDLGP